MDPIKTGQLVKMATGHFFRDRYGYGIVTSVDGYYMWVWFAAIAGSGAGGFKWCEWNDVEIINEAG